MKLNTLTKKSSTELKIKKKIYIAYNLMTLSILSSNSNFISLKNTIFWPDGIINFIFHKNKHIPGRFFLIDLLNIWKINNEKVLFIGSFDSKQKKYLEKYNNCQFINCIFGTSIQILNNIKIKISLNEYKIIVLCISSPKQEELANILYIKNKNSIYCMGAALNFLSGVERPPPSFIYKIGFEWAWRFFDLKNKRISRFIGIVSKLNFKKLKEINYVRI